MSKSNPADRNVKEDTRSGEGRPAMVVGIGVGIGGAKSLKRLLPKLPSAMGTAYVLICHPDATGETPTLRQLKNLTAMAVEKAEDGMTVLADRIHVMPPEKFLNISGGRLTFREPIHCNGLWMPVDHFFCSLASDQKTRGCGILLSGEGGDGTFGLSEIKAAGGRTFVETPGSAESSGMAESAIDAGTADGVLPVEAIAEAVAAFADQSARTGRNVSLMQSEFDPDLQAILEILRTKIGHDFRCYKPSTLVRRIRRRMTLGKIGSPADYVRFLGEHPDEVGLLRKDLLIGVTEFFRQPQAWETLEEKVVSVLVENARNGSEIRAWIPGCSTGKEAYSLAMLLAEQVEKSGKKVGIQIFATDSDVTALAAARSGSYPEDEVRESISSARLKQFFTHKDGRYQILKAIREQIVFAPQNITADPPFSRLDLISCRNLLMYLDQSVQQKIIALFHFALREGGFLFLGTAETVGDREDLFEPVSKKWRIYRRIGVGRPVGIEIPVHPSGDSGSGSVPVLTSVPRLSLASAAQQMLLDRFAPACVMIDRRLQVLYVHGAVEDYLTFPPGELTLRVVDMAREGLRARLRGAIGKCLETHRSVSVAARVRRGGKSVPVRTTVSPLRYPREADGLLLVAFEDIRLPAAKMRRRSSEISDLHQLEDELKVTREELQSTIEQMENSNDQLKASNEEVTAANEELQSANEELETSKEELQSLNEELNTINARLQEKVDELETANNDVVNLLSSTSIATVFLDKEFRVKRYTPAITGLMSLIPSDVGRPIVDVLLKFSDEALLSDARGVLASLASVAKEVQADDGRWYIRRIMPYRTQDDRIEGVVVTFVDVTDFKNIEEALSDSRRRLSAVVDNIADGFFALDREWRFTHINDTALSHFGRTREEVMGHRLFEVFPGVKGTIYDIQYRQAMESGKPVHFETPSLINDLTIAVNVYPGPDNITILFRDITEQHRMEEILQTTLQRLHALVLNMHSGILLAGDARIELANQAFCDYFGLPEPPEALVGLTPRKMIEKVKSAYLRPDEEVTRIWEIVRRRQPVLGEEITMRNERTYLRDFIPIYSDGKSYGFLWQYTDITERKRAEGALRKAKDELEGRVRERTAELRAALLYARSLIEASLDPLVTISAEGKITDVNHASEEATGVARAQLIGSDFSDYFTEPDAAREGYRKVLEDGQIRDYPLTIRHASGRTTDVLYNATVYRDEADEVQGVFAAARDVTERRRAEEAVKAERQRLFDVLEMLPVYVLLLTPDYHVPFANRFFEERFGKSNGRRCYEYLFNRTEPCEICETYRVLKTRAPHHWEWMGPDGRNYDIFDYPFTDSDGSFLIMEVGVDVTEAKQAQGALIRMNETLEQRVADRTAQLQSANRELESFAYSVSHDLRAPLRAIDGFSKMLVRDVSENLGPEERRKFQIIRDSAQKMGQLIDDLLAFSRLGRQAVSLADIDMEDLVRQVWKECLAVGAERQMELKVDRLPWALGDSALIRQVLSNLLSNAVKFTKPRERAVIEVGGWREDGESVYYVKDNGVGFDMRYRDKLFGVFQRLHGADEFEGTGVGLALVQRIIHRHGGRVWAEGKEDEGATFYFSLPEKGDKPS